MTALTDSLAEGADQAVLEAGELLADPAAGKYLEGKTPKKVVVVPGKIVNVVC